MSSHVSRILILCKTYPTPSAKHAETSCVAGMDQTGRLIRLFPVPFRLISGNRQFKKWQWISARIEKANADHRPESHKIYVDTVQCDAAAMPAGLSGWGQRRVWIDKLPVFSDFAALEARRQSTSETLGLLRPARIVGLDIKPAATPDWTDEEKAKLLQLQQQGNLFDAAEERRSLRQLRKVPYDFHYRYECDIDGATIAYRHKLVDWEVGALFWNLHRTHGRAWETPFRDKLERKLPGSDLMFLLGTIHRFPDKWLIVSLIYPPRLPPAQATQTDQAQLF